MLESVAAAPLSRLRNWAEPQEDTFPSQQQPLRCRDCEIGPNHRRTRSRVSSSRSVVATAKLGRTTGGHVPESAAAVPLSRLRNWTEPQGDTFPSQQQPLRCRDCEVGPNHRRTRSRISSSRSVVATAKLDRTTGGHVPESAAAAPLSRLRSWAEPQEDTFPNQQQPFRCRDCEIGPNHRGTRSRVSSSRSVVATAK